MFYSNFVFMVHVGDFIDKSLVRTCLFLIFECNYCWTVIVFDGVQCTCDAFFQNVARHPWVGCCWFVNQCSIFSIDAFCK